MPHLIAIALWVPVVLALTAWGGILPATLMWTNLYVVTLFIATTLYFLDNRPSRRDHQVLTLLVLGFLIAATYSLITNGYHEQGLLSFITLVDASLLFVVAQLSFQHPIVRRTFRGLLVGFSVSFVFLLLGVSRYSGKFPEWPLRNPNHLAGLIELLIFPIAFMAVSAKKHLGLWWLVFLNLAFFLMLTSSRGGYIAVGLTSLLLLMLLKKHYGRLTKRALLFTGLCILGVAIPMATSLSSVESLSSNSQRWSIYKNTAQMVTEKPWMGLGLGSFASEYLSQSEADTSFTQPRFAHSDYLQLLAEQGVVGFALLLMLVAFFFRRLPKDWWKNPFRLGLWASICCLLIHSLFDFNLRLPSHLFLWTLLAAYLGSTTDNPKSQAVQKLPKKLVQGCIVLLLTLPLLSLSYWLIGMHLTEPSVGQQKLSEQKPGTFLSEDRVIDSSRTNQQQGNLHQALDWASMANSLHRTSRSAEQLATTWESLGFLNKAETSYLQALQRDPMNFNLHLRIAQFHLRHDHLGKALELLKALVTKDEKRLPIILALVGKHNWDPLLLQPIVPQTGFSWKAWVAFLRQHNYDELALQATIRASERFIDCEFGFLQSQTEILAKTARHQEAQRSLQRLRKQCPQQIAPLLVARIEKTAGNHAGALEQLSMQLWQQNDPETLKQTFYLAAAIVGQRPNLASVWKAYLEQYTKKNNNEEVLFELAKITESMGEWKEALRMGKQLLAEDPLKPQYYSFLAGLYKEAKMEGEALRLYLRACRLYPKDVNFRIHAARIYLQLDLLDKAEPLLKEAQLLAPKNKTVELWLRQIEEKKP